MCNINRYTKFLYSEWKANFIWAEICSNILNGFKPNQLSENGTLGNSLKAQSEGVAQQYLGLFLALFPSLGIAAYLIP